MSNDRRNFSLSSRNEDVREANRINPPVHFSIDEIKNHFDESLSNVKGQFDVAQSLYSADMQESLNLGKARIMELFQRRNEIAHQNDRDHATASQNDISKEYVESYISSIESIVSSVVEIIKEKDNQ